MRANFRNKKKWSYSHRIPIKYKMRANFRNKKMVLFTQDTNQICIPAPPPTSCILQSLLFYEKAKSNAFLWIRLLNKSFFLSFTKIL